MKFASSFTFYSLVSAVFAAAIFPRDDPVPDDSCCFHLRDTGVPNGELIRQDYDTGYLYLSDPNLPVAQYCLHNHDRPNVLWDRDNNACILAGNDNSFQCLDGTPGGDTWKIVLAHPNFVVLEDYGSIDFTVCDVDGRKQIFGPQAPAGLNCRQTQLLADDRKGQCSL